MYRNAPTGALDDTPLGIPGAIPTTGPVDTQELEIQRLQLQHKAEILDLKSQGAAAIDAQRRAFHADLLKQQ